MIDPGTAMVVGSGLSALGGLFGGGGNKAAAKEQGREFDVSNAPNIARLLQSAPLRDKILAIMGNLATTGPSQFKPTDLFNPAGVNPNAALGARPQSAFSLPAGYQDGSGDYQTLLRQALHTLGYHQFDPRNPSTPAAPVPSPAPGGAIPGQRPYFGVPTFSAPQR